MDRFQYILDKKCDDLLSKINKLNRPKDINKKNQLLNLQSQLNRIDKVYHLNSLKSEVKTILKALGINFKEDIYTSSSELKKQINNIIGQGLDSFKEPQSDEKQKILKIKQEIKKGDLKNIKKVQGDLEKIEKAIHHSVLNLDTIIEEELSKKHDEIELGSHTAVMKVIDADLNNILIKTARDAIPV